MKLARYFLVFLIGFYFTHAFSQEENHGIYNVPTQIQVNDSWKVFIQGSFIYWQAKEEGLEIALENPSNNAILPSILSTLITTHFKYSPGFKIALGYRYKFDEIVGTVEYTRLHQKTRLHTFANNAEGGSITPLWLNSANSAQASNVKSTWKLNLDILDGNFSSKYAISKWLYFKPFFGVRAAWIDQKLKANYFVSSFFVNTNSQSESWGLGPKLGIDSDWLLYKGFYGIGNASISLLYTKYKVSHSEQNILDPNLLRQSYAEKKDTLRPNIELSLGIGWGNYFIQKKIHLDFKVRYDFSVFFYQNMMRYLVDLNNSQYTSCNNNLYLHGLTIKAQFDF